MKCGQLQGADKNQPTKWGTDFLTGLPNIPWDFPHPSVFQITLLIPEKLDMTLLPPYCYPLFAMTSPSKDRGNIDDDLPGITEITLKKIPSICVDIC